MKKYIAPTIEVTVVNTFAMMWGLEQSESHGVMHAPLGPLPERKDWVPVF